MRTKWIFRRDEIQGFYRVLRLTWERGLPGLPGGGYSAKLTFALDPRLFCRWRRDASADWRFTAFGVRLHYCRSYGGIFP